MPDAMREKDSWRYRRIVVFAVTATSVALPFYPHVNAEIYWPFYTLAAAAVGAYIGFATWEYQGRLRSQTRPRTLDNPD